MSKPSRVGYLITGRLKSTRLPKKLLLPIEGKSIISHMIDRLKLAKKVDEIIICTSTSEQDKPLAEVAKENNIQCFFGDAEDVLLRLLNAADAYGLDYILNITADCPFVDPDYADKIVEAYGESNADLIRQFDLPHGAFSYGIKVDALRKVIAIKADSDTEVWGRYFTDTGLFNVVDLEVINPKHKRPGLRMTLDYPEDFEFFRTVFKALYKVGEVFSLTDILDFLDEHPDVVAINCDCGKRFITRWKKQSEIKLKSTQSVSKAIIIGCGSIGQRHIRNLKAIGINDIIALRSRKGHHQELPAELGVVEVDSWDEVIAHKPDIAVISNPTSLHLKAALKIVPYVKGVMIEKPLSHSLDGSSQLIQLLEENKTVLFMGHNLMFHPIVTNIMDFMDSNEVGEMLSIQCQVGQWLPDWHPYEDFTKAYYANKKLGGGAALTLIHEIHLVTELAGMPLEICGMVSKSPLLDIDVDVMSDVMVKHKSGCVSQIHLDFIQKPSHRSGLITFERGWISYDFNEQRVIAQGPDNQKPVIKWVDKDYDANQMYINQMKKFVKYVKEARIKHSFDIHGAIDSLKIVEALFESDKQKKIINVEQKKRFEF